MIAGELITSATVRMVLVAGMPRSLPTPSSGRTRRSRDRHQTTFTCPRHGAHVERVLPVTRGRDSHDVNPLIDVRAIAGQRRCPAPTSQAVLDERRVREDWLVPGLAYRLGDADGAELASTAPAAAVVAAVAVRAAGPDGLGRLAVVSRRAA